MCGRSVGERLPGLQLSLTCSGDGDDVGSRSLGFISAVLVCFGTWSRVFETGTSMYKVSAAFLFRYCGQVQNAVPAVPSTHQEHGLDASWVLGSSSRFGDLQHPPCLLQPRLSSSGCWGRRTKRCNPPGRMLHAVAPALVERSQGRARTVWALRISVNVSPPAATAPPSWMWLLFCIGFGRHFRDTDAPPVSTSRQHLTISKWHHTRCSLLSKARTHSPRAAANCSVSPRSPATSCVLRMTNGDDRALPPCLMHYGNHGRRSDWVPPPRHHQRQHMESTTAA